MNIGYFEAFNVNRSCLVMDASQLPSAYSHIHFAFGGISEDYQVTLGDSMDQFQKFVANSTGAFKRILSFGGWSFSTE
jgi:chitinase